MRVCLAMCVQSIDDYVIANYDSHGVYQNVDDDQAGSAKMMI